MHHVFLNCIRQSLLGSFDDANVLHMPCELHNFCLMFPVSQNLLKTVVGLKVIPQFCIAHFFCAYLNVAYCVIYEDKLNCKRQRKSKDKEK